ncbi:phosphoribosylanthranilate isomerase [Abditibacterium utsteinense]|uniref:N-(5'-phosphoribosyl)anthranilate isomerase n=1 Tax=Abditibacterium utsteinense TaxID=1960156 RepID=A0A2S8SQZ3_9BACT|nr:phosphoribosylanthranilate isomerase [Abditibacterium utsteinense]PQV63232.1 phosphoribosylanthranilate isomerase [Abditibacterium utsteinense]
MPLHVKICGTTSILDARLAQEAGADFLGVMLNHPASPRNISLVTALEIQESAAIPLVALSVNQDLETLLQVAAELSPRALQLHGDESPALVSELVARGFEVWKAISGQEIPLLQEAEIFREAGARAILVDAREVSSGGVVYGGTGQISDWNGARELVEAGFRVILAGGLSPGNVARAITFVQPWALDVVSGVETRKGVKDAQKLRQFVSLAKTKALGQNDSNQNLV